MKRFLAVKGFQKFQHYRDRDPVWIKLYTNLLIDADFLQLQEAAQAQLMKLWLLASQLGNPLPNNPKLLAGKIGALGKFHLPALIASGFLIPTDDCASDVLANPEQDASESASKSGANREQNLTSYVRAPARSRGERELERDSSSSIGGERSRLLDRLTTDADKRAVSMLLDRVPLEVAWTAELHASLDAMGGHAPLTAQQLGEAVRDYMANGHLDQPNMRHFRAYLSRMATAPAKASRAPANDGEDALDRWARETEANERKTANA